jgi:predicted phosphodiesterase
MALSTLKNIFRIQYVSDLHLEMYKISPIFTTLVKPCCKYLALAGDIGHPQDDLWKNFFNYVSKEWEHIFYVPGNHEYYNKNSIHKWKYNKPTTFTERNLEIKKSLKEYKNITLLDTENPVFHLSKENITIIGSTLWSYIPIDKQTYIFKCMNDYNYIAIDDLNTISPKDINKMWSEQRKIISDEITLWTLQKKNIIVLTHHLPSFELINEKYKNSEINYGFASNCEDLLTSNVKAWIYGHTHFASENIIRNTKFVVNPKGYQFENVEGFSNGKYIEIDLDNEEESNNAADLELSIASIGNL